MEESVREAIKREIDRNHGKERVGQIGGHMRVHVCVRERAKRD